MDAINFHGALINLTTNMLEELFEECGEQKLQQCSVN